MKTTIDRLNEILLSIPTVYHDLLTAMADAIGDNAVFIDASMSKSGSECYVKLFRQKAATICIGAKASYISCDANLLKDPESITKKYTSPKGTDLIRLYMDMSFNLDAFLSAFKELSAFYRKYPTVERFGCCHLFNQCSDDMRCVYFDKYEALGCYYRENLESGKIFYGRNASHVQEG